MVVGFEEMLPKQRPPRRLWLDDDGLEEHFKAVFAKQGGADDDDPEDDPGMVENEDPLVKAIRGK